MATPDPIVGALTLAEDAILQALAPFGGAWWGVVPPDDARRLRLPATNGAALERGFVAQHQDGGGEMRRHFQSERWEGLVTIRVYAQSRGRACQGVVFAATALQALPQPEGYTVRARWIRPRDVPVTDPTLTARAGVWMVTCLPGETDEVMIIIGETDDALIILD